MTLAYHIHKKYIMYLCDNVKTDSPRKMKKIRKEKARQCYIQVTLDG